MKNNYFFDFSIFSLILDGFLISSPYFGPKVGKHCKLEGFFKARTTKMVKKTANIVGHGVGHG